MIMTVLSPTTYRWVAIVLIACACGGTGWGADPDQDRKTQEVADGASGEKPSGEAQEAGGDVVLSPEIVKRFQIVTRPLEAVAVRPLVIAPATVMFNPETTVHIGTVVAGRVTGIHAKTGDGVGAGAPLVTIDSPELGMAQNEWLQKRALIAVAEADVDIVEQAYARAQTLAKDNNIATGEMQRRKGEATKARAIAASAKAAFQAAENTLHIYGMDQAAVTKLGETGEVSPQVVIRATTAGTVINREVALGEVARPDKDALMTLADTRELWVVAHIQSDQARFVTIGDPVRIALTTGSDVIESKVVYIAPNVDSETRALAVRMLVAGDAGLRAGMYVDVEITPITGVVGTATMLAVPRDAVFTMGTKTVVFVAESGEAGHFKAKRVAVAPAVGSLIPVVSGLEAGDEVVTHGGFIIKAQIGKATAEED